MTDSTTRAPGGKELRVLHVINEMGVGGAETLVITLVTNGRGLGWRSWVASSGGALDAQARHCGAMSVRLPLVTRSARSVAHAAWRLRAALRETTPDVVLAHNVGASVVSAMASMLLLLGLPTRTPVPRPRIVTVFHGVADADLGRAVTLLRHTSPHVVAVSAAAAGQLRRAGHPQRRLTVVPNAAQAAPTSPRGPESAAARARLGVPADQPMALCLARMVEQKRHDVLLAAWARTESGLLLLAGDGPLRSQIEQTCVDLGLSHRVRFLGVRDDVGDLLAACDLTVLASDWEGLPMAVLESLGAGRPVVATSVGGLVEAIDQSCGRLVAPGDPAALATAIDELIDDAAGREALSRGATKAAERFSVTAMMSRYDELLRYGTDVPAAGSAATTHPTPA